MLDSTSSVTENMVNLDFECNEGLCVAVYKNIRI